MIAGNLTDRLTLEGTRGAVVLDQASNGPQFSEVSFP